MSSFENTPFEKIRVGQEETVSRTLSKSDIEALAFVSGDLDPYHISGGESREAETSTDAVASEAFVSYILNRRFPGPGTRIDAVELKFRGSLKIGDTVTATLTVQEKQTDGNIVVFKCRCTKQSGEEVASGTAVVTAPTEAVS